jgi:hypothetical protein
MILNIRIRIKKQSDASLGGVTERHLKGTFLRSATQRPPGRDGRVVAGPRQHPAREGGEGGREAPKAPRQGRRGGPKMAYNPPPHGPQGEANNSNPALL